MIEALVGFAEELRSAGIPVGVTETLDASAALLHVDISERTSVKAALAATMVKNADHYEVFSTAFEVFFSLSLRPTAEDGAPQELTAELAGELAGGLAGGEGPNAAAEGGGAGEPMSAEELRQTLLKALMAGDDIRSLARAAVRRFAGMEPGRPVGGTYYLYRTMRQLNVDDMAEKMIESSGDDHFGQRLARDEVNARIENLRRQIEDEIRRLLVADRGAKALARSVRKTLTEDIDFVRANQTEMEALRRSVQPLTRKLAARLARKRRHNRRGALDFRATMRSSMSTGGVPADPRFKRPRPAKPEIFVIADISGSVSAFARFTLHLIYAINSQFSRVRSFAFVDGIDEVTTFFDEADEVAEAISRINTEADVLWVDGHSDYGHALTEFWERWGNQITSRTTVLLLGDTRNNYHTSQAWVLGEIRKRARHLYLLNPEPRGYWGSGDSIVGEYAPYCDDVVECRNLRQLERFVDTLV